MCTGTQGANSCIWSPQGELLEKKPQAVHGRKYGEGESVHWCTVCVCVVGRGCQEAEKGRTADCLGVAGRGGRTGWHQPVGGPSSPRVLWPSKGSEISFYSSGGKPQGKLSWKEIVREFKSFCANSGLGGLAE